MNNFFSKSIMRFLSPCIKIDMSMLSILKNMSQKQTQI